MDAAPGTHLESGLGRPGLNGTWTAGPTQTRPSRRFKLLILLTSFVAVAGVAALIPTAFTAAQLREEVSVLKQDTAKLHEDIARLDEQITETSASSSNEIDVLAGRLEAQAVDDFDPAAIVSLVEDGVFTIVSGNSQGSGFGFISNGDETWVATNYHVIKASTYLNGPAVVVQHEGSEWIGEAWNWDEDADVALVKVSAVLPVLESAFALGNPPAVGDSVLAYGSPLGFEGTATVGIISAIRGGYIQTDAQINHGNSGGPLVNATGEVLGLTSLGYGEGSGVGFAIDIRTLCARLMRSGC